MILVIRATWLVRYVGVWRYIGGDYKEKQNRCRELGVLPKSWSKNFLKRLEYLTVDDFEGKKRLHGVNQRELLRCDLLELTFYTLESMFFYFILFVTQ